MLHRCIYGQTFIGELFFIGKIVIQRILDTVPVPIDHADETRNLEEAADETALLLVPGVAFDKDRHRCGYGKGFYDRYLSRHTQHATVAMALDFQIVETVPSDVYDICPQMLITPTMIYGK